MVKLKPTAQAGEGQSAIPAAMEAGRSTFFKWKKDGGSLPRDTVERISHLLAIHKALEILLPETRAADGWIRRPNAQFNGQSALDVMRGGQVIDIYRVRQYVDAQRGG